jgi:hypothetical protein
MRKLPLKRKILHLTFAAMLTFSVPSAAFSQASTTTTNTFVPFSQVDFVFCANGGAGEGLIVSGVFHIQTHTTINPNRSMFKTLIQRQEATGIGLDTGDVYRSVGVTQFVDTIPILNGAQTFTVINKLRLIGPGPGNNVQLSQQFQITINANGEVTADVDHSSLICK